MKYATGYAVNTEETFTKFPSKKLKMTAKECEGLIGNRHKEKIAQKIFSACVSMVIDDVIDNNIFHLPTTAKKAELSMTKFDREKFTECRKNGKFEDIDFLSSNFEAYQMAFVFQSKGVMRKKLVYLDPIHKNKITEYINQGKQYYGQIC